MPIPEPVKLPIDPANPPEFPGAMPAEVSLGFRDQLHEIAEKVALYLGPDHRAIKALTDAACELALVVPFEPRYAEYTPGE